MQKRRGRAQTATKAAKSTTATTNPSTPLRDRTQLTAANMNSVSTKGESSFLPELHSTPPMPTVPRETSSTKENYSPPGLPTPKVNHTASAPASRPDSCTLPALSDPGLVSTRPSRSTRWMTLKPSLVLERLNETPPLPEGWNEQHDRIICMLDLRDYTPLAIVSKVRRTFPELKGTLTPGLIDRRLRQLDQDIEIDYWKLGLEEALDERLSLTSRVDSGLTLKEAAVEPATKMGPPSSRIRSQSAGNLTRITEHATSRSRRGTAITQRFEMGYRTSNAI